MSAAFGDLHRPSAQQPNCILSRNDVTPWTIRGHGGSPLKSVCIGVAKVTDGEVNGRDGTPYRARPSLNTRGNPRYASELVSSSRGGVGVAPSRAAFAASP